MLLMFHGKSLQISVAKIQKYMNQSVPGVLKVRLLYIPSLSRTLTKVGGKFPSLPLLYLSTDEIFYLS